MKVLQINAVSGIRSTGRICVELSDYLNENSNEGYIAYSEGNPYLKEYIIGNMIEKKIHGLSSRIFGKQAYFSKNGTKDLVAFIEKLQPDVVHLHNLHSNYINLEILLKYLATEDIPTVLTLHDCWFFTGKCTHYTVDNCMKWINGCNNCPRLKKDNPSWFLDRTPKMYRDKKNWFNNIPRVAIVGVSDWITREAKKSFLSDSNIITRIHNWVDLEIFKPIDTNQIKKTMDLQNKFVILGVASIWSNEKGLEKFIELSSILPNDMVIILVGNISITRNIPSNIIHLSETHNVYNLVEYYSLADVLVNLSVEETFGMVTAEALSCGTPAIVINSTANPELIAENCGHIINDDNISEILNKINMVKNKKKEFYKDNCINYAFKNFNKKDRLFDYMSLYKSLLSYKGNK